MSFMSVQVRTFNSFAEAEAAITSGEIDLRCKNIGSVFYVKDRKSAAIVEFIIKNYGNAKDAHQFDSGFNLVIVSEDHASGLYTLCNFENSIVKNKFPFIFTGSKITAENLTILLNELGFKDKKELKATWEEIAHLAGWPRMMDSLERETFSTLRVKSRNAAANADQKERENREKSQREFINKYVLAAGFTQRKDSWGDLKNEFVRTCPNVSNGAKIILIIQHYEQKLVNLKFGDDYNRYEVRSVDVKDLPKVVKAFDAFAEVAYKSSFAYKCTLKKAE